MPPPTGNEIRLQLKSLFLPVIGTAATKKAKIIEYLAYAFTPGQQKDPTNLRSELDSVSLLEGGGVIDRVNCLMLSEGGFSQVLAPRTEQSRTDTRPRGKNALTRTVFLTYFYQFGEASELTFSDNVELIRVTLNDNPKLGFANIVNMKAGPAQFIDGHDGWQVPSMPPLPLGGPLVHVADGPLTIRLIEPLGS